MERGREGERGKGGRVGERVRKQTGIEKGVIGREERKEREGGRDGGRE